MKRRQFMQFVGGSVCLVTLPNVTIGGITNLEKQMAAVITDHTYEDAMFLTGYKNMSIKDKKKYVKIKCVTVNEYPFYPNMYTFGVQCKHIINVTIKKEYCTRPQIVLQQTEEFVQQMFKGDNVFKQYLPSDMMKWMDKYSWITTNSKYLKGNK